jgi:hypothetical protein
LTIVGAARKKDSSLLIENGSRAAQPYFPLPADTIAIKHLCHVDFPFLD